MSARSVHIYDENMALLWDSANYSDIVSNNTELVPIVPGPTWNGKHGQNQVYPIYQ